MIFQEGAWGAAPRPFLDTFPSPIFRGGVGVGERIFSRLDHEGVDTLSTLSNPPNFNTGGKQRIISIP